LEKDPTKQEKLSIVIVDSGMGGLSICADIANGFVEGRTARQVDLIYFNAWPEQNRGYNSLPDTAERVRVFNSALESIEQQKPDMILIACNTLSILYPETPFSSRSQIPVIGIIEFGVQMMYERMQADKNSRALILGTLTTVNSEAHKNLLVEKGIEPERIVGQQCNQLATRIESGPQETVVGEMIDGFLSESADRFGQNGIPVYAVFCCTHFGYAREPFAHWLKHHIGDDVTILNPNTAMSDFVINQYPANATTETIVNITVLSRITWHQEKVNAIADTLSEISQPTAEALRNYRQDSELFVF